MTFLVTASQVVLDESVETEFVYVAPAAGSLKSNTAALLLPELVIENDPSVLSETEPILIVAAIPGIPCCPCEPPPVLQFEVQLSPFGPAGPAGP